MSKPMKSRDQRQHELVQLLSSQEWKFRIVKLWNEANGHPGQALGPIGASFGHMIEQILDNEYTRSQ